MPALSGYQPVSKDCEPILHTVSLVVTPLAAPPSAWIAARLTERFAAPGATPGGRSIALAMIITFAWAALVAPSIGVLFASLGLGWTLVCLARIDLVSFRLPDLFTLPLLGAGLAISTTLPDRPIIDHLVGAAIGWGALAVLGLAYRRWRGVDGIGLGDAKLLGAAGAWLGWRPLPSVVLIASAVAFVWVAFQAIRRGRAALSDRLAFGAPLCLAIWITWLHGALAF